MSGRGWLPAVAGLVALACMMTPNQQREDTLIREARTFNDDLRWARYEQLSAALPRDEAPLFLARANAVGDDLVMADFEVTSINFGPGSDTATVGVSLQWYTRRASILHSTTIEQRWELRSGRWLMAKQRRVRGDRFPLVLEPITQRAARHAAHRAGDGAHRATCRAVSVNGAERPASLPSHRRSRPRRESQRPAQSDRGKSRPSV